MKSILKSTVILGIVTAVIMCSVLCTSAVGSDLSIDFESGSYGFIAAGDLNADGKVNANDLVVMKHVLLNTTKQNYKAVYAEVGETAKYSDVNGDGSVDVRDLIRAKKCTLKSFIGTDNGMNGGAGMNVYGNVAFVGGLSTMLDADRYYELAFDYRSDEIIKITVNGITDREYTFESKATVDWTRKTYLIATAEEFTASSEIEVQICGNGVIDNITITPCTIDNDLADTW